MKSEKTKAMALAICVVLLASLSGVVSVSATASETSNTDPGAGGGTSVEVVDSDFTQNVKAIGDVIKKFKAPDGTPNGLTWDGKYLWNSDVTTKKIYKINPSTGSVITSFSAPGKMNPSDLAWDGSYLWHSDFGTDKIYKLTTTGTVVSSFKSPGSGPEGLAWDGSYLWHADGITNKIYKLTTTGTVVTSFAAPANPDGLAWDGGHLWVACNNNKIYKLTTTGTVVTSFSTPATSPNGLAFDGQYLWHDDSGTDLIYQIDAGTTEKPTIFVKTDKFKYCPCNEMLITIDISNPTRSPVIFKWYLGAPTLGYWGKFYSTKLPAGFRDTFEVPFHIGEWGKTPFSAVWYVDLQDPETGQELAADCACWSYCPTCRGAAAMSTSIPPLEDIATEIGEEVKGIA